MRQFGHSDKCIYCLIEHLNAEIVLLTRQKDDLFFSFQILEFSYSEVHAAYEAAVQDNQARLKEIADTRKELLDYLNLFEMKEPEENTAPYVDPTDPMRLKKANGF